MSCLLRYDACLESRWLDHGHVGKRSEMVFVRIDGMRLVTEVGEKIVISNDDTAGVYNFRRGADFVAAAEKMIENEERVNGEFCSAGV